MRIRAAVVLSAAALVGGGLGGGGFGGSASAAPPTPGVTVTHENGGTQVRTGLPGQPLVSVSSDSNGICYGFSLQIGRCVVVPLD